MFTFKEMDSDLVASTKVAWCKQAEERSSEILVGAYQRILNWAEQYANGGAGDNTYAYALIRDSEPEVACAILEITHARPNSDAPWLKVLSIHVEPQLEVSTGGDVTPIAELAKIAARSVVEAHGLTFKEHPSSQLKVYASTPLTLAFLEGVTSVTLEEQMGIKVTTHGNWLVIDKI